MNWMIDPDTKYKYAISDTHSYFIGLFSGKYKLSIVNSKTKKEKVFNLFNKDEFFVEKEAETIIDREAQLV